MGILIMTISLKKGISKKGIELIKFLESDELTVYRDSAGIPTVGVGHVVLPIDNLKVGDKITQAQSTAFLKQDLRNAENTVKIGVKAPLNKNQYDALVSFVFNVGSGAFKSSSLLRKLNTFDYQGALEQFGKWKYITVNNQKVVSAGLVNRRKYEQQLFNS